MIPDRFDSLSIDILKALGISEPILIGKGDQAWVYKYKPGTVIKIYRKIKTDYLESLAKLEKIIAKQNLPFAVTEIYEIHEKDGIYYTLEKELMGKTLGKVFFSLSDENKEKALVQFLKAIDFLKKVTLGDYNFGQVLTTGEEISASSWVEFLNKKLTQRINLVKDRLEEDVYSLEEKIELLHTIFSRYLNFNQKCLVHGDYFYNNVLYNDDGNLTAMLDFSNSTVVGDYRMDIACGIMYFDLDIKWKEFLEKQAVEIWGKEISAIIKFYTVYQAFFQTESCLYNEGLYKWCLSYLNSDSFWEEIRNIR